MFDSVKKPAFRSFNGYVFVNGGHNVHPFMHTQTELSFNLKVSHVAQMTLRFCLINRLFSE